MSEPVAIITSEAVEPNEFRIFLKQLGATLNPDPVFDARLSARDKHVWIALHNENLDEWEDEELAEIEGVLGRKARSHVTLEISRTEGSERMAIEFACQFAKRWACVVDDLRGTIYSVPDLSQMLDEGRDFTDAYRLEHALSDAA